jgi:acyl-CoA synthetase (AMP-forming)/AMP-acid ligase II
LSARPWRSYRRRDTMEGSPPVHLVGLHRWSVIPMTNLAHDLREAAQMYPDRPAVRLDDTVLSYARLDDLSARAAAWFRERGLGPGDPVGIMASCCLTCRTSRSSTTACCAQAAPSSR